MGDKLESLLRVLHIDWILEALRRPRRDHSRASRTMSISARAENRFTGTRKSRVADPISEVAVGDARIEWLLS
jgi:hypothetical protein